MRSEGNMFFLSWKTWIFSPFFSFCLFSFSLFLSFPLFPFLFLLRFTVRRNLLSDTRGVSLTPLTPLPVRLCGWVGRYDDSAVCKLLHGGYLAYRLIHKIIHNLTSKLPFKFYHRLVLYEISWICLKAGHPPIASRKQLTSCSSTPSGA